MQFAVVMSVAVAGALGAVCRYAATLCLRGLVGDGPWPVAVINVIGCFGFGLCLTLLQDRVSQAVYVGVLAGFFGAFTTFSAFAFDGVELLESRKTALFLGNAVLQTLLGAGGLWLGVTLASRG